MMRLRLQTLVPLLAAALAVAAGWAVAHPGHQRPEAGLEPGVDPATVLRAGAGLRPVLPDSGIPSPAGGPFRLVADQAGRPAAAAGAIAAAFAPFEKRGSIACREDDRWFYVESNGIPDHLMMVGIRAWQQQVPLPQPYRGSNAWQIPLHPVPAAEPRTARNAFLRGAIAVAINGVPIFNPLNNRGEDASAIGELDTFGGHCGRADDYHYHLPPVHLEEQAGRGMPIAYALDGYPIYGFTEPDGSPPHGLDALNGHETADLGYHYHATKTYPYLNGGFHGQVVERDGQVDPQPRAQPLRAALPPLPGARIVAFTSPRPDFRRLVYEIGGRQGTVEYTFGDKAPPRFTYTDPAGRVTTEEPRPRGGRAAGGDRNRRPERPPPPGPRRAVEREGAGQTEAPSSRLVVTSSAIAADGQLPAEFTCDGAGVSPPVAWAGAPAGTRSFALSLWHESPDGVKSYWVMHGIPATVEALPAAARGIGTQGLNDRRLTGYDPMCSRGPGIKTYHLTVYALREMPRLPAAPVTREQLLATIAGATLAEGSLTFTYTRAGKQP